MKRTLIAVSLLAASIAAAHAFGLGLGSRMGHLGAAGAPGTGGGGGGTTGTLLKIDGVSHILKLDGTSKICRIGGCS